MSTRRGTIAATVLMIAALLSGAAERAAAGGRPEGASPGDSPPALRAFVSIIPQQYFVERVGGDRVQVEVLVRPGQSPELYEPTPRQMSGLSQADLFFRIGMPFEEGLLSRLRAQLPNLPIVDTREGVPLLEMEGHSHEEEEEEDHEEGSPDPHIWLDPKRVAVQARTIRDGLIRLDPEGRPEYERNCEAFLRDLETLDRSMEAILAPVRGRPLYVFHPTFGYLADAYGLRQVAIEVEGKEPSARQLGELIERARADGVRAIFIQPQFNRRSAETVARSIGAEVLTLDPLEHDYLANMEAMARQIADGLGDGR